MSIDNIIKKISNVILVTEIIKIVRSEVYTY